MTLSGKGKTWLLVIFASAMVLFSYSASREIAHQLLTHKRKPKRNKNYWITSAKSAEH